MAPTVDEEFLFLHDYTGTKTHRLTNTSFAKPAWRGGYRQHPSPPPTAGSDFQDIQQKIPLEFHLFPWYDKNWSDHMTR
jgi:hypothetical protein